MSAPAIARWIAVGQNGQRADWAGTGMCTAKMFDENHVGGPAVLIELHVPLRLQVWVSPEELEQMPQPVDFGPVVFTDEEKVS